MRPSKGTWLPVYAGLLHPLAHGEGIDREYPRGFGSLKMALEELQTIQLNTIMVGVRTFEQVTEPNDKQLRILAALGVNTLL